MFLFYHYMDGYIILYPGKYQIACVIVRRPPVFCIGCGPISKCPKRSGSGQKWERSDSSQISYEVSEEERFA